MRVGTQYRFEKKLVSPKTASQYLKRKYVGQRKLRISTVERYARDMKEGRWYYNSADHIVFDASGNLMNGQHRLHAVVKSGESCTFAINYGGTPDMYKVMDGGEKRRVSDFIEGDYKNTLVIAALARPCYALKYGTATALSCLQGKVTPHGSATAQESLFMIEEYGQTLEVIASNAKKMVKAVGVGTAVPYGIFQFLVMEVGDSSMLPAFLEDFTRDIPESHTILRLKSLIMKKHAKKEATREVVCGLLLAAYNAYLKGDEATHLRTFADALKKYTDRVIANRRND